MAKNPKKSSQKELDKKCAIGRAAVRLFGEMGYLETTLKDISDAAQLSKGGIYHYFSNKHEILYFVLDNYMDRLLEGLLEELERIPENDAKIEFVIFRHLRFFAKKPAEAKALLIDSRNLPSEYFKIIAEKEKAYAHIFSTVLWDYLGGSMPIDRIKAISYTMFGMCNAIMYWYDPDGLVTIEELSRICYDIFTKGVRSYRQTSPDIGLGTNGGISASARTRTDPTCRGGL
ncbi:MAG: TetR/AcrR family transcriptional regulator [Desulfomonilaceae bacterium]|nr:TetR/AcrR family transcriptional regulator [Desulfomonilaceae bacterium]